MNKEPNESQQTYLNGYNTGRGRLSGYLRLGGCRQLVGKNRPLLIIRRRRIIIMSITIIIIFIGLIFVLF